MYIRVYTLCVWDMHKNEKGKKKKEIEGGIYARMFLSGVFCTHSDNVINNLFKSYIIDDEERNISYV